MIVDSSAIVAIVFREPGFESLIDRLTHPEATAAIGTPTIAETGLVLSARMRSDATTLVAGLLAQFEIVEVPFDESHWPLAIAAFNRYGKGRHRAGLNFGDCLTYAVARLADEPLLFVGDDFAATDLDAA